MTNKWQGYGIDELQARKMLVKARVDMQQKELQDSYRGVIGPVQNSGSVSKFISAISALSISRFSLLLSTNSKNFSKGNFPNL